MKINLLNLLLAFFEGFALIISPCILPILPIILSGSISGGKKRPIGIILGFIIFFTLFTYCARWLVQLTGINLDTLRDISFVILILLGCIMISDYLTQKFDLLTQKLSSAGSSWNNPEGGFIYGLIFGALIGLIWTPCAGPILAAVIVQTILQKNNLSALLTILCFSIGTAIPMLLIALFGQRIMTKLTFFKKNSIIIRKLLGIVIILTVIYLFFLSEKGIFIPAHPKTRILNSSKLIDPLKEPYPAPVIEGISDWINSPPLTLTQLRGQVVLIDFWAYSCINCIRTFPELKSWYAKYHPNGFTIIGVHSPEFDFESKIANVTKAAQNYDLKYPIALDNHFVTWQNYHNQYWPADYLIDKNGQVVYEHFGEGDYDIIENNIRVLLGMNQMTSSSPIQESLSIHQTPETYLGYEKADNYRGNHDIAQDKTATYSYPDRLATDQWTLQGQWLVQAQKIIAMEKNASIKLNFEAKKVYAVMGTQTNQPITIDIKLNGQLQKSLVIQNHDLYPLMDFNQSNTGDIELITSAPGLEIYTFTFG